jgi:hypothetical protein
MPLFDFYVMVDWSGGARRRARRSDTIWIASGSRTADAASTVSPHSRTEAIDLIESILDKMVRSKQRTLLCFDFAYSYPVDFAASRQSRINSAESVVRHYQRRIPLSTLHFAR